MVQPFEDKKVSLPERRLFLQAGLVFAGSVVLPLFPEISPAYPGRQMSQGTETGEGFTFAQLQYRGGEWNPEPLAWPSLRREVESSSSIVAESEMAVLTVKSPDLFSYPFIYMTGTKEFHELHEDEIIILRKYLRSGGTLFADDCGGMPGYGFDSSFRKMMERVFPDDSLKRLPSDHTVFRSFYMVRGMGGRRIVSPFLEGIGAGRRTPVIYSSNALGEAWARDSSGRWVYPVKPGEERQRKIAFQLGVNIIMYALCDDYKQDRIHLPFLRQKI